MRNQRSIEVKNMSKKKWKVEDIPDQSGKKIIVTGANSGTGYEAAKALALKGAHVIMACRNMEKAEKAKAKILKDNPNASLEILQLDLSDLSSVRSFAENYRKNHDTLDILLNNGGIMMVPKRIETVDGFELQLGTNHFGHFALTGLLFDLITKVNGRIVNMSSTASNFGSIDFENLNWEKEKTYSHTGAYGRSKIANLYFTYEMDRRLKKNNNGVKSMASHPGWSRTSLQSTGMRTGKKTLFSRVTRIALATGNVLIAQSAAKGALPMLYAATSPDAESGAYYGPGGMGEMRGHPKKVSSNELSHDETIAKRLWEISEELIGLKYEF